MTTDEIASRLNATKSGTGWKALCPSHADKNPSLSITPAAGGRTLLFCHAGCKVGDIVAGIGLKVGDLSPEPAPAQSKRIVAAYRYSDKSGCLLFEALRFEPKGFAQRRPAPNGGWVYNLQGVERVLYRLPALIKGIEAGNPVFVVEGEKDADNLAAKGLVATCNPMGAGKWRREFNETFRGASVAIIADKDDPGRAHAQTVAENLHGIAGSVRVFEVPEGKDASDYLMTGKSGADFLSLADGAADWEKLNCELIAVEDPQPVTVTSSRSKLPAIIDATDFMATPEAEPHQLVEGLLHQGSKLVLGGGSKSFKTWTLLDLAVSVSHGFPWLGRSTIAGPVLYLNFEIQNYAWQRRIEAVSRAKEVEIKPDKLKLWNLRGYATDFGTLLPEVSSLTRANGYALIVLDPIYKLYGGTDENKAGDVAALLNAIEHLATQTGAAVAFGAHFSKGNQSQKEAIDRISGSGVFARDPDSILIFTRHEEEGAFTIEPILRNFAPVAPFAVRWKYPLFESAGELDPAKLKQPTGRKQEHPPEDLLRVLPESGLPTKEWMEAAEQEGIKERTFYRLRKVLEGSEKVIQSKVTGVWQPIRPKNTND